MSILIPRKKEFWLRDLVGGQKYEIDRASPYAEDIAAAVVAGSEIAAGIDYTVNTTSMDGADIVATDNTVNAYIQEPLLTTSSISDGRGDFSLFIHAKIAAYDGTISNLVGNKNDLAGGTAAQGFLAAHANQFASPLSTSITLFTYSAGTTSIHMTGAVTGDYQDIFGSREVNLLTLNVGDSTATASSTVRDITGSDPRFIVGHSGKATHADAGAFQSPIALAWNRTLTNKEYQELRQNPAQVLKPRRKYWVLPVAGVQAPSAVRLLNLRKSLRSLLTR